MSAIAHLTVTAIAAPMARPWVPEAPTMHLLRVDIDDTDGRRGTGFSWTPTIGAAAVAALLREDIARFVIGRDSDPEQLWPALWAHLHEAGGGGLTTIAMAGVDLALWDLRARAAGRSVAALLGQHHDRLPVYGSGVNLHYSDAELAAQVERWLERGITAVKIKVGRPDLAEDLRRVRLVRSLIGPEGELMIDANQRWDLATATHAIEILAESAPSWIEEPLRADDTLGYTELARRIATPIALGENLHTIYRFQDALAHGFAAIVQPNIVRVGGITPFRTIVEEAETAGVRIAPHLLPDLSGQLAATLTEPCWVEDVEDAGFEALGILAEPSPVQITGAWAHLTEKPGLGLDLISPQIEEDES